MITCAIFRRHLDAVVDGEVDLTTQIEFEQHLNECGPCRDHLAFAESFKRQVRDAVLEGTAPPSIDLASRIARALDEEDARSDPSLRAPVGGGSRHELPRPLGFAGLRLVPVRARYAVPAAVAAAALLALVAHEGGNRLPVLFDASIEGAAVPLSEAAYLEDVVDRHWREHPAEVSGPPMQVETWFRDKLEFPVRPMQFQSPDVRLVGARLSNVRDRQAAAFYYDVHGRRVTVLVFEPSSAMAGALHRTRVEGRGVSYGQARGHTVPLVQHDGLTYAIAGDLDSRTLLQLAAGARVGDR